MNAIIKAVKQAVLTQTGIAFPPSGTASKKGADQGAFTLTEEKMRTLTDMLHEHGGPQNILQKDVRLLMELPGTNLKTFPQAAAT